MKISAKNIPENISGYGNYVYVYDNFKTNQTITIDHYSISNVEGSMFKINKGMYNTIDICMNNLENVNGFNMSVLDLSLNYLSEKNFDFQHNITISPNNDFYIQLDLSNETQNLLSNYEFVNIKIQITGYL